ncbi:MAG TPA: hypothetical protein VFR63_14025 [Gaiellaceae bacterium]|nr:hypothetical protein [Gaiellaceae bacterium]
MHVGLILPNDGKWSSPGRIRRLAETVEVRLVSRAVGWQAGAPATIAPPWAAVLAAIPDTTRIAYPASQ